MSLEQLTHSLVGLLVFLRDPQRRDERGLSQSTENALLLAGAAAIAGAIVLVISNYVSSRMPK